MSVKKKVYKSLKTVGFVKVKKSGSVVMYRHKATGLYVTCEKINGAFKNHNGIVRYLQSLPLVKRDTAQRHFKAMTSKAKVGA